MKLTTVGMNKNQYFIALKEQKKLFRVAYNTPVGEIGKWKYSNELEGYDVDYREIFDNESVIDIDAEDWRTTVMLANKIRRVLVSANIPFIMAWSGGKGIHFHIFFDMKKGGVIVELTGSVKSAKQFIMTILLGYAGIYKREMQKEIDPRKLSPNEGSSLIREFGGWKMVKGRQGKKVRSAKKRVISHIPFSRSELMSIPVTRPRKIELFSPEERLQQIVLMTEWVRLNNPEMYRLAAEQIKKHECYGCKVTIPEENVMYPSDACYLCTMKGGSQGCFVVNEEMTLKRWVEEVGYNIAMENRKV